MTSRGAWRRFAEISRSGVNATLLHPLGSATTIASLAAMLAPYLLGLGIARGIRDQAEDAIVAGADVYVSGTRFGRQAPVPRAVVHALRGLPGVRSAEARIVGAVKLGREQRAFLVGVEGSAMPAGADLVEGRMWSADTRNELVLGAELARQLGLRVGDVIPPFYHNDLGEHVSRVVGIFRATLPIWQSRLVFTSLATAAEVFAEPGCATTILLRCVPEYRAGIADAIHRLDLTASGVRSSSLSVVTRDELGAILAERVFDREGGFAIAFMLAFAIGIPLLLTALAVGLGEQRRQIGLLKALGWRTDEVVLRGFVESLTLAALGTSVAILVVWLWVRVGNGIGVAHIFVPEAELVPGFAVPFRLLPVPLLLAAAAALAVTSLGSLWSAWRAAATAPADALR